MKVSVIVPTLDISRAQKYVGESLKGFQVNIVYVLDTCRNASNARNKGVEKEKDADILFFIDDVEIDQEHFKKWLALILEDKRRVIWNDRPLIFGISRNLFLMTGGFDERIPFMSEDIEMYYVLKKLERSGILRLINVEGGYIHHSSLKDIDRKRWLNEKHSVYTFLKHDMRRLLHALKRYHDGWKIFLMRYVWLIWAVWKLLFFKRTRCRFC
ncbi:MAG: glycosyltransferase family A protein [Nitrososphaerota archaeon]|nr:glycosyltransferase family 2 protein [Aigarchaeota archaeon]MDW8076026.1 glycosyltransferase family A protein [Nitrososphaerota archaeon]